MRRRPRAVPGLALVLGAMLVLAGCDDDPQETSVTPAVGEVGTDDGAEGDAGEDVAQDAAPVEPPTEPMELELAAGERSVTADGSTIRVEGDRAAFVLPTGNIACVLTSESATCQIDEKSYSVSQDEMVPDLVGPCDPAEADAMRTIAESGAWTCVAEDLIGAASLTAGGWWEPEVDRDTLEVDGIRVAVLPYGERIQVGPVWCESSEAGVTCANPELNGRRFQLSRSSYGYDRTA